MYLTISCLNPSDQTRNATLNLYTHRIHFAALAFVLFFRLRVANLYSSLQTVETPRHLVHYATNQRNAPMTGWNVSLTFAQNLAGQIAELGSQLIEEIVYHSHEL